MIDTPLGCRDTPGSPGACACRRNSVRRRFGYWSRRSVQSVGSDEAVAHGEHGSGTAGRDADLGVDVLDVGAHGPAARSPRSWAISLVGTARGPAESQHLDLPSGQPGRQRPDGGGPGDPRQRAPRRTASPSRRTGAALGQSAPTRTPAAGQGAAGAADPPRARGRRRPAATMRAVIGMPDPLETSRVPRPVEALVVQAGAPHPMAASRGGGASTRSVR